MACAFEAQIHDQIVKLVQSLHTKLFTTLQKSLASDDISQSLDPIHHEPSISTGDLQTTSSRKTPEPPTIFSELDIPSSGDGWPFDSGINFPFDPSELAVLTEEVSFDASIDFRFEGGDLS